MKKPTIKKMKLLVAKMLPEYITVEKCSGETEFLWEDEESGYVTPLCDREWLYVCHLAEHSLGFHDAPDWPEHEAPGTAYSYILNQVCRRKNEGPLFASAESRLEALCRIKHPNLFQ